MRKLMLLAAFALVATLVLAATAVAQEEEAGELVEQKLEEQGVPDPVAEQTGEEVEQKLESQMDPKMEAKEEPKEEAAEKKMEAKEKEKEKKKEMPKSGGPGIGSLLVPAGVLLLGSGVVALAVIRRR
jgi:preprotein translocase subunit SecF